MTVRWTLWLLASLVLSLVCRHATAQDLVTERAIFEDSRGDMTFEQVRQVEFSKADKVISKGYTNAALWIRLTVDSPTDEPTLVLRVYPAILDEVTLFSPDRPNTGLSNGVDRGEPVRERASLSILDVQAGKHIYYLRIKTNGAMLVASSVVTVEQAHQEDITRGIVLGAVLACYLPLMITLLVLSVKRREPLHILFLLNFSVSVAVFFGWFGYLQEFAGTDSWIGSTATLNFLGLVNIFTGTLFLRVLLGRFGLPRWGRHLFTVFFVLYIPVFFLFFALDRQVILSYSTMWGFSIGTFMLPVTVYVFYRKNSVTWLVAPIFLTAILLSLRTILILQGVVAPDESTVNLMAFRIFALTGFCATILLLLDREKRSLLQTSILNETVARRLADAEKNRREIQERFMTMLMHELKTPLAIIQLAATSLGRHMAPGSGDAVRVKNINHSVNDLNALIERCVQADQIEQGAALINKRLFSANAMVRELVQAMGAGRILPVGGPEFMVFSDEQYVRLILNNLLSNALKYSPSDSMIELKLQSTAVEGAKRVTFCVSNSVGTAGIPDPAQVFTRYYRSEAARRQVGAGLGLWLAQAVARQLGSEVHFRADQGQVAFSFGLALA